MTLWKVTLKHARGAKYGNRAAGETVALIVEAPEKLQAGTIAMAQAKEKGINGYYVAAIREAT